MDKLHIWRLMPGFFALLTAVCLILVAVNGVKPIPDDPEPVTMPALVDNPYGPEDFTYDENGYLTCTAGKSVLGIDVSIHQGDIDWQQVKDAGIEFVMIRMGYRGYGSNGTIHSDSKARENYAGAKAAGLKIGGYFFSQAISVEEAMAEAYFLLGVIRGWELDMPLVFDWEPTGDDTRTANMDPRTLTDCATAFCRIMRRAGYEPMVYFNLSMSRDMLYLEELTGYDWWLARYADTMDFGYRVTMWQYTSEGSVPGIEGDVDLNLWFPEE